MPLPDTQHCLHEVQEKFWTGLRGQGESVYALFNSGAGFLPQQRMEVYRTTARSAHVGGLQDVYPVCRAILGDDYFAHIARQYFRLTPSRNADMNMYGESFAGYIAKLLPVRTELAGFDYLVDLARLEWMYQEVYYAADETEFAYDRLQQDIATDPEGMMLQLQPTVRILSTPYPVHAIWQTHRNENVQRDVAAIETRECLCLFRQHDEVIIQNVSAHVYTLLSNIQQHKSLAEIAECMPDSSMLNDALATVIKSQWLANQAENA